MYLHLQFMKIHAVSLGEWLPFKGAWRLHIIKPAFYVLHEGLLK